MSNRRTTTTAFATVVLTLVLAACGSGSAADPAPTATTPTPQATAASEPAATPDPTPTADDEPTAGPTAGTPTEDEPAGDVTEGAAVTDGSFAALIEAEEARVAVDEIEILSGEEAVAAREDDGEPPVEEGLDVPYLRNRSDDVRTLEVADEVVVTVYDCTQACEHVEWSYADLVAGAPLPYGDAATVPFVVTVEDGVVVELSEVYLP